MAGVDGQAEVEDVLVIRMIAEGLFEFARVRQVDVLLEDDELDELDHLDLVVGDPE